MPSISNPDALQEKRERGAREGNKSLFDRSSNVSIARVRKQCKKENGSVAGEDGSLCGGPGGMPMGRGRSGGGVRLRPVSGIRGEGGGVLLMGAGASGAPVLVLEAVGCGRRAKVCLARFILRHAVAAVSSIFSSSACLAIRSSAN